MTKTKRLAIYLRSAVSDDEAIAAQRDLCSTFADAQGCTVCAEYIDNGIGGLRLNRPGMNALISDMKNGVFDTVMVKDIARVSHDPDQFLVFMDLCTVAGVALINSDGENLSSMVRSDIQAVQDFKQFRRAIRSRRARL